MHERIGISPRTMMVALLAAVLTLGLGTSDLLAQKPDKPGNGKGKGGGGNGGGSSEYPATMALRDAVGDRILSDGAAYDEGVRIRDDGLLLINISDPRTLTFDFTDQALAPECSPCKKSFNVLTTSGVAASAWVLQDGSNQTLDGNLLGMATGETKRAQLKFGWGDGGGKNGVRWSLRFKFPMGEAIDTAIMNKTHYAQISRVAQDTWIIEASVDLLGDQALLISQFKQKGQQIEDEGTYHMPFEFGIVCPTCP